jgi:hypothetical protein
VRLPTVTAVLVLVGWTSGASAPQTGSAGDVKLAAGLHQLFLHDACTGEYPPQPDTCLHKQLLEPVTFGGKRASRRAPQNPRHFRTDDDLRR